MTISEELNIIYKKQKKVIDKIASDFFSELVHHTPVKTGTLKGAWSIEETKDGWLISNNMEYATIVLDSRMRIVAGKRYGSEQFPAGIDPIIDKYNIIMEVELKKIKGV